MATLIFCTSYAPDLETWETRYARWLRAVREGGVQHDQILIVDDGSPVLPSWTDMKIVNEGEAPSFDAPTVLFHFAQRLGRSGVRDYPGWFRSFCFVADWVRNSGFTRVIHIESDAFVISKRFTQFVNEVTDGWVGLKLPRHQMPESAIQIISGTGIGRYFKFSKRPYSEFRGRDIETCIPYTKVVDLFKGDRYGEYARSVPFDADWSVQVFAPSRKDPHYFWWMEGAAGHPTRKSDAPSHCADPAGRPAMSHAPHDRSGSALIWSWCEREIAHWEARQLEYAKVAEELHHRHVANPMEFLYRIREGQVELADKPPATPDRVPVWRPPLYLRFLREVVRRFCPDLETDILVNVGDGGVTREPVPVFTFQKPLGGNAILLPDVDFLENDFYYPRRQFIDDMAFDAKFCSAVFAGSTTGTKIDADAVRRRTPPRLRSALFFKDNPKVNFRLPVITRDTPEDARALLLKMGIGKGDRLSYADQFKHKFIISMDGFGATCSRIPITLNSNSVLLKYNSPHQLYYFSGMLPWFHYIPIAVDEDVNDVIRLEEQQPGKFAAIARQGKKFAETYLTRLQSMKYTAWLLRAYANSFARVPGGTRSLPLRDASFGTVAADADASRPSVDVLAHIAFRGDTWYPPNVWIGEDRNNSVIEGFALEPCNAVRPSELAYEFVTSDGSLSRTFQGGEFCGSRGKHAPIFGLAVRTTGEIARDWECAYSARFADGTEVGPFRQGAACQATNGAAHSPLRMFRLEFVPRSEGTTNTGAGNGSTSPFAQAPVTSAVPNTVDPLRTS